MSYGMVFSSFAFFIWCGAIWLSGLYVCNVLPAGWDIFEDLKWQSPLKFQTQKCVFLDEVRREGA